MDSPDCKSETVLTKMLNSRKKIISLFKKRKLWRPCLDCPWLTFSNRSGQQCGGGYEI